MTIGHLPLPLQRLRKRSDFVKATRHGRKWATKGLVVQIVPREDRLAPPSVGLGLTASKKVGGAVVRNRAKRRLRALAIEILPLEAKAGIDVVLIARQATPHCPYNRLRQDLRQALAKLKVARGAAKL